MAGMRRLSEVERKLIALLRQLAELDPRRFRAAVEEIRQLIP